MATIAEAFAIAHQHQQTGQLEIAQEVCRRILSVDPKRASDPDVAGDAERERLLAMAGRWSREDLLRAFDLLTKAEQEIRVSDQPRYNLEMALLRLMHLRKLVPLAEMLGLASQAPRAQVPAVRTVPSVPKVQVPKAQALSGTNTVGTAGTGTNPLGTPGTVGTPGTDSDLKDRLLGEIKSAKSTFYNLVVAQAYRIEVSPSGINFVFQANQKNAKQQADDQRAWVQQLAEKLAGKPVPVTITLTESAAHPAAPSAVVAPRASTEDTTAQAMANATVQAVLEIFPVEKTTVEEI